MTMFRADVLQFLPFQQATGKRLANGATRGASPRSRNRLQPHVRERRRHARRGVPRRLPAASQGRVVRRHLRSAARRHVHAASPGVLPIRVHTVGEGHAHRRERTAEQQGDALLQWRDRPKRIRSRVWVVLRSAGGRRTRWPTYSRFMPGSAGSGYRRDRRHERQPLEQQPVRVSRMGRRRLQHGCGRRGPRRIARRPRDRAAQRIRAAICCPICRRWAPRRRRRTCSSRSTRCGRRQERPTARARNLRVDVTGHHHLPSPQVLKLVGDAYKNAPVLNPDGTTGIRAHFDVGSVAAYHGLGQVHHDILTGWTISRPRRLTRATGCRRGTRGRVRQRAGLRDGRHGGVPVPGLSRHHRLEARVRRPQIRTGGCGWRGARRRQS